MRTHPLTPLRSIAALLALASVAVVGAAPSQAAPSYAAPSQAVDSPPSDRWAPAATATIYPGVMMYTKGSQCTGNFVFLDRRERVYVGYAAHCAGTGAATDTNGCKARSRPLGTRVRFASDGSLGSAGTTVGRGRLVYSSWRSMQRLGSSRPRVCAYNDFALVRVGSTHVHKMNPSVPFWGGPVGLNHTRLAAGDRIYSYGNSSLRGGATELRPKTGAALGDEGGGWTHPVYTLSPGVPGDSGSGFLDAKGRATGVLSTLTVAPAPLSNGVGDLARELAFARKHAGIPGLRLVRGTEPFSPLV